MKKIMNKEIIKSHTDYCQETIGLKKTIESGFIALGERLSRIKAEEMWLSQWETFSEYLLEMGIKDGTASRLISVYKLYVENLGIEEKMLVKIGWAALYEIREMVEGKTKSQALAVIENANQLNRNDVREMVRESRNGACDHDFYEVHLQQCRICGRREKVYDG